MEEREEEEEQQQQQQEKESKSECALGRKNKSVAAFGCMKMKSWMNADF